VDNDINREQFSTVMMEIGGSYMSLRIICIS
jgi:hypothetical protein